MTFVTIELNKQMRKEVTGSSPVGGIFIRKDMTIMVFVHPAKTYDFNTHTLSVEKVEVDFTKGLPDGTRSVTLNVYGQVVAKKSFLSKLGFKPKPQKYRISIDYSVLFEKQQVIDQSFNVFEMGYILNEEGLWVHNEDLVKLVSRGIKDSNNFAFITESFNAVKPNLYLEVKRLYNKFGF